MPAFKDWKQVQTQAQLMETCVAAASPSRPTPSCHLPCRGMLMLSGVLACSVLSRMRSLPTSLTLPVNMVSRGAPTRLRPPAWSSRASRACVSRANGQAGKQTGMQIDKEAYGQPGKRPDRQTGRQAGKHITGSPQYPPSPSTISTDSKTWLLHILQHPVAWLASCASVASRNVATPQYNWCWWSCCTLKQ